MPAKKHSAFWVTLVLACGLSAGCNRGPVDPVPQYGDVSGYVRTSNSKKAIEGATVTCAGQTYTVTRTGIYVFTGVPEGYHLIRSEKVGYDTYTASVRITDNTVHNVYMDKVVEYRDIAGHVYLDNSNIPVEGVSVVCDDVWDTTDADGGYLLQHVLAETHALYAFKNHYISHESRVALVSDTTIDIYLASASLSGTLRHRIDGPVGGARVEIADVAAYSSADGGFRLPVVPRGTHRVTVSHTAYDSLTQTLTIIDGENTLDTFLTRSICDTLPITDDASIAEPDLLGCGDCPAWGDVDENFGQSELLRLEYFLKVDPGPPTETYSARTRVLISLPPLPEEASRLNMSGVRLVLYPVDERQPQEYVSLRPVKGGSDVWSEDVVTWADQPEVSQLLYDAVLARPGQPLTVEVLPLFVDLGARPSLLLQGEEVGEVDPPRRLSFYSSECPDESLRPVMIVRYSF